MEADPPDYSEEELAVHYRILADQIGNLLSRISSPKILSKMGTFKAEDREVEFDKQLSGLRDKFEEQMEAYGISRACEGVMDVVGMVRQPHCFLWLLCGLRERIAHCSRKTESGRKADTERTEEWIAREMQTQGEVKAGRGNITFEVQY